MVRKSLVSAAVGAAFLMLAPMAQAAPFPNCTAARDAGMCNIPASSEYYQAKLDRDQDGIGCEC